MTQEKEGRKIRGGKRRRGGGYNLGCDATFLWSRASTHPPRGNLICHNLSKVEKSQGPCPASKVAFLDSMPLFGFGFRYIIGAKETYILLIFFQFTGTSPE